jgi:hypothetical protein
MATICIVGIIDLTVQAITFILVRNGTGMPEFIGETGVTFTIALAILLPEECRNHRTEL